MRQKLSHYSHSTGPVPNSAAVDFDFASYQKQPRSHSRSHSDAEVSRFLSPFYGLGPFYRAQHCHGHYPATFHRVDHEIQTSFADQDSSVRYARVSRGMTVFEVAVGMTASLYAVAYLLAISVKCIDVKSSE